MKVKFRARRRGSITGGFLAKYGVFWVAVVVSPRVAIVFGMMPSVLLAVVGNLGPETVGIVAGGIPQAGSPVDH